MSFSELINEKIPRLLERSTQTLDNYEISFKYLGYNEDLNVNTDGAYCTKITAKMCLKNTDTLEEVETNVDLLDVPVATENGYRIGKTYKQVLGVSELSPGWFILEPKKDDDNLHHDNMPVLSYKSVLPSRLQFYVTAHQGVLKFTLNKDGSSSVNLDEMLKVLSGKGNLELMQLLGNSRWVLNTFNPETTQVQALNRVRNNKLNPFGSTPVSDSELIQGLKRTYFEKDVYGKNVAGYKRYLSASSFVKRVNNCTLARDVRYKDVTTGVYKDVTAGTLLTKEILVKLDADPNLDTLYVESDGREYCVKKYAASKDSLTLNEMYTMINMYINKLDGLGVYDKIYDQTSRIVVSYDDRVLSFLTKNVIEFSNTIFRRIKMRDDQEEDLRLVLLEDRPDTLPKVSALVDFLRKRSLNYVRPVSNTNLLSKLSVDSRIVTPMKNSAKEMIGVQEYELNRNDAIDQPESDKVGKIDNPSILVKTDEYGFQTAPYLDINTGEIVYLTASEEESEYIAPYEEDFSNDYVRVFQGGSIKTVPKREVKYKAASPQESVGIARAFIPFQEFNNSKRLLMGSNHQKQAIFTEGMEKPRVSTGLYSLVDDSTMTARKVLQRYYKFYKNSLNCSEEEFCSLKLKLINTSVVSGERVLHFSILDSAKYVPNAQGDLSTSINVAYLTASDVKSIYGNVVDPSPGNIYTGDDIVYHNINVDTNKKELMKFSSGDSNLDYGKHDPKSFDNDLAIGVNLLVGYKTWEGSTIEDSIVLRRGLCYDGTLTSVHLNSISYKLYDEEDKYVEKFGVHGGGIPEYITSSGLPEIGTVVFPGDSIIYKTRTYSDGRVESLRKSLDRETSGEVVSAEINERDRTATVVLAKFNTMETGDKMAGRYGNKGVVGKIVPDEDMPYIAETGEILDVILNPLGIPSRMNLGQALEIILGRAAQLEDTQCVISPFNKNTLDFMKEKREEHKIYPQLLIDGRTGEPFERPVEVGIQYMLTLHHKVKAKSKSICVSRSVDQSNGLPTSSTGAQAIGEMETWAFEVSGCNKILQDLFTYHSNDYNGRKAVEDLIRNDPREFKYSGQNNNNVITQAVLMALGVKLSNGSNYDPPYEFSILTDKDITNLAPSPVNPENKQSLDDVRIFGTQDAKYKNMNKFGYVSLGCEMVNPFLAQNLNLFESILINKVFKPDDSKFANLHRGVKTAILNGTAYVSDQVDPYNGYPVVYSDKSYAEYNEVLHTGIKGFIHLLKLSSLEKNIERYEAELGTIEGDSDKLIKHLENMKVWAVEGKDYTSFITRYYPILPSAFRASLPEKRQYHDLQKLYEGLLYQIKEYMMHNTDDAYQGIYSALARIIGLEKDSELKGILQSYFGRTSSSKSKFRETVLKKRVNFSGRSIIIPTHDVDRGVMYLGVPIGMAFTMLKLHLRVLLYNKKHYKILCDEDSSTWDSSELLPDDDWADRMLIAIQNKNLYRFRKALEEKFGMCTQEQAREIFQELKNYLVDFAEQQVILAGRQPTLHQYGIRGYKVKIVEHRCIEINTLSCSGYNADFDGDTMYLVLLLSDEAKKEGIEKLTIQQSIVNPKDGDSIIKLSQDMLLGIYAATMLYDNETSVANDPRYRTVIDGKAYDNVLSIDNIEQLNVLVEIGDVDLHQLVSVEVDGRLYVSTAGRLLFNSLIPEGFTDKSFTNPLKLNVNVNDFCDLKYDGIVTKKGGNSDGMNYISATKIMKELYDTYSIEETFSVYQKMSAFGFKCSDKVSITLGVTDFYEDLYNNTPGTVGKMDNHYINSCKDAYRKYEAEVSIAETNGYITEAEKVELLHALGSELNSIVQPASNKSLPRNNNLFIIKDSGARGNEGQIGQTIGMGGTKMKTLNTSFDVPVMSSYAEGLTTYEMSMDSFASRQGVASTQLNTADAGYALRQMVYMTNGVKVEEVDCGAEPSEFKIEYNKLYRIKRYKYDSPIMSNRIDGYTYHNPNPDHVWDSAESFSKSVNFEGGLLEILEGQKIKALTELDFNYLEYFVGSGFSINNKTVNMILKKKIKYIYTEDYAYELSYTLTPFYKSYIKNRYIVSIDDEVVEDYADDEFIEHVIDKNPENLVMRTTLNCKCHGCCQKCYGLKYATDTLPDIGEMVGIEGAQAIGEPVTQLTMNLFHTGGVAGKSVSNGVELNKSLLGGGLPTKDLRRIFVTDSGHVNVDSMGNNSSVIANFADQQKFLHLDTNLITVEDGEYVDKYSPITAGFADFMTLGYDLPACAGGNNTRQSSSYIIETGDDTKIVIKPSIKLSGLFTIGKNIDLSTLDSDITLVDGTGFRLKQQLEFLKMYHWNFSKEDIAVYARHFEILVKVQTNTITVTNTNLDGVRCGNIYSYQELKDKCKQQEGGFFMYPLGIAKQSDVVLKNSGPLSAIVFERVSSFLNTILTTKQNLDEHGFVSRLVVGEPLDKTEYKSLMRLGYRQGKNGTPQLSKLNVKNTKVEDNFEERITVELLASRRPAGSGLGKGIGGFNFGTKPTGNVNPNPGPKVELKPFGGGIKNMNFKTEDSEKSTQETAGEVSDNNVPDKTVRVASMSISKQE